MDIAFENTTSIAAGLALYPEKPLSWV